MTRNLQRQWTRKTIVATAYAIVFNGWHKARIHLRTTKKPMTPKEKAEELIDKFRNEITSFLGDNMKKINAKKCALVAVDELIKIHYLLTTTHDTSPSINYWKEVKQELEKL